MRATVVNAAAVRSVANLRDLSGLGCASGGAIAPRRFYRSGHLGTWGKSDARAVTVHGTRPA